MESNVRYYSTIFPKVFVKSEGSYIFDADNKIYIDFLSGCGSLNYGHNDSDMKQALLKYIEKNGVSLGLDLDTPERIKFVNRFRELILDRYPEKYKIQFCGPTGTNANEAALRLAKKYTQRKKIVCFSGGYHGMTSASMSVSDTKFHNKYYSDDPNVLRIEFPQIDNIESWCEDVENKFDLWFREDALPAAIITELIQADGGVRVFPNEALTTLKRLAEKYEVLIIIDEVQTGCGRTGKFFSFSNYDIYPDMITISKSISGYGIPMSLLLFKEKLDIWEPGEYTGTFRGNSMAFVTAEVALSKYWQDRRTLKEIQEKSYLMRLALNSIMELSRCSILEVRGIGMIYGMRLKDKLFASKIREGCFKNGLIFECCGEDDTVIKIMPALNIPYDILFKGFDIIKDVVSKSLQESFG